MASTTYDEIPYDGQARYHTHPDRLATMAALLGMDPAPVDRCRVLEIGCGTGGNLIPMAMTLPNSQFVGIDYSQRHIQIARDLSNELALPNIEWHASDIRQIGSDFGAFDYILCHGVFSWVPAAVQDHILFLCKRLLHSDGIAYISYNTYPGWHLRGLVREAAKYHVRGIEDPQARVPQARAFLRFLVESNTRPDSAFAKLLEEEQERWSEVDDYYLFHEHLEEDNHPLYFHEFAGRAASAGLQFLSEAWQHSHTSNLSEEAQRVLRDLSGDLIQREQYLDFLRCRMFRRTLLVHGDVALDRKLTLERLTRLRLSALARPAELPEGAASDLVRFVTDESVEITTAAPLVKALLFALFRASPHSLTFDEVVQAAVNTEDVGQRGENIPARLAESIVHLFLTGIVGLHYYFPEFARTVPERPRVSKLARIQAMKSLRVTNLRHGVVKLPDLDRRIVTMLDGTLTPADIVERLVQSVASGELNLAIEGRPVTDTQEQRAILEQETAHSLERLVVGALLVAESGTGDN